MVNVHIKMFGIIKHKLKQNMNAQIWEWIGITLDETQARIWKNWMGMLNAGGNVKWYSHSGTYFRNLFKSQPVTISA